MGKANKAGWLAGFTRSGRGPDRPSQKDRSRPCKADALTSKSGIRVIILTPGMHGLGGISRMMDAVGEELSEHGRSSCEVVFVDTRGDVRLLRPWIFLKAVAAVATACARGRCDVLHVNVASYGSTFRKIILSLFARASNTPYIVHLHGGSYREFWNSRCLWAKAAIDGFFRDASRVIVLGSAWGNLVKEHVPDAADRVMVLPNATRTPSQARNSGEGELNTILFLGQLSQSKGVPQLVEALALLKDLPGWRAVLAGNGDVAHTRALVQHAGLGCRVSVPGWVRPDGVEELLRNASLFVLPSFVENQPLSIIEAFAHGVPVVCTPVGSIPEVVTDGRTGIFVAAGDSVALSGAIRSLLEDPDLRRQLALNAAAEHAARFQLGTYVDCLVAEWHAAARERDGPTRLMSIQTH